MNRRKFVNLIGVGAVACAAVLTTLKGAEIFKTAIEVVQRDGLYDSNDNLIEFVGLEDTVKKVETSIKYKSGRSHGERELFGSSVVLDKDRILTAAHVVDVKLPRQVYDCKKTVLVGGLETEILYLSPSDEFDLAVLRNPDPENYKPIQRGNSDELKVGNIITTAGFAYGVENLLTRPGHIVSKKAPESFTTHTKNPMEDFIVAWNSSDTGDSGGGVFAYRDGKIELVGITKMKYHESVVISQKINDVMRTIELMEKADRYKLRMLKGGGK